jgi:hypothetical protein
VVPRGPKRPRNFASSSHTRNTTLLSRWRNARSGRPQTEGPSARHGVPGRGCPAGGARQGVPGRGARQGVGRQGVPGLGCPAGVGGAPAGTCPSVCRCSTQIFLGMQKGCVFTASNFANQQCTPGTRASIRSTLELSAERTRPTLGADERLELWRCREVCARACVPKTTHVWMPQF